MGARWRYHSLALTICFVVLKAEVIMILMKRGLAPKVLKHEVITTQPDTL